MPVPVGICGHGDACVLAGIDGTNWNAERSFAEGLKAVTTTQREPEWIPDKK